MLSTYLAFVEYFLEFFDKMDFLKSVNETTYLTKISEESSPIVSERSVGSEQAYSISQFKMSHETWQSKQAAVSFLLLTY